MKTYTLAEAREKIIEMLRNNECTLDETDNSGQIVIYTGLFVWTRGPVVEDSPNGIHSVRDEPEPYGSEDNDV